MDDEMFDTQCRDVAKCIKGLSMTLVEAGADTSISKVISDVHKLIQSFRLLGNHYVSELLKKRRELEAKSQEVKELSRKLERGESHHVGAQKSDGILAVDARGQIGTTIPGDRVSVKNVEEFSMREHDLGNIEIFQTWSTKSEELDKSLKGLARLEGYLDQNREEMFAVQKKVGKMAVCNEFLSRDFAQAREATVGIRHGERSRGINSSTAVSSKENDIFLESFNELGAIEQSCNKRRRENEREDSDLQVSRKSKPGTVQEIVAQEQNMVETLCKAMEQYEQEFLETFLGTSACDDVAKVCTLD